MKTLLTSNVAFPQETFKRLRRAAAGGIHHRNPGVLDATRRAGVLTQALSSPKWSHLNQT